MKPLPLPLDAVLPALRQVQPHPDNDETLLALCEDCCQLALKVGDTDDGGTLLHCPNCEPRSGLAKTLAVLNAPVTGDDGRGPRLWPVGAFLAEVGQPPPMLVDGVLTDRTLMALAGKPKHLKSFVALDLMDAVCQGQNVFGLHPVNRAGSVVYFGMEDGRYEVANRLLQRGLKPGDTRPFHICTERLKMGTSEGVATMQNLVAPVAPVLIVVDTAREALGIADWFNPAEVSDKLRPLRDFARDHCTVLLIAHNRKADGDNGDEISGTNAFTSSIDGWLSVYRKEVLGNGNTRLFLRKEGRGGLRGEMAVEMDTHTLHFSALSPEQIAEAKQQAQEKAQETATAQRFGDALRVMAKNGDKVSAPELARVLETGERNAQNLLKEMAGRGLVEDRGERDGRTKSTILYSLSDAGKREARKARTDPMEKCGLTDFGLAEGDQ